MQTITAAIMAIAITISPIPEYDIALSAELQEHTYNVCSEYEVEYELMLALMWQESRYEEDVVSSHGAVGICQILPEYHEQTAASMGLNLYNTKDNISYATYLMQGLIAKYGEYEALAIYNAGFGDGGYDYADRVLEYKCNLKEGNTL